MGILVGKNTRLVVQGITGREGSSHAEQMLEYGTNIVAGVTPGRGGQKFKDTVPVYDTVAEAVEKGGANTSIIFVPPPFAGDAMVEAAAAGIELVICITEGVPVIDTVRAVRYINALGGKTRLIGPNCPGVMTPGESRVGIMPSSIFREGNVGVVSRSGTLTYEVVDLITKAGMGVSTCTGVGGDPVIGTTFVDVLELLAEDPKTEKVLLIGEIGGTDEETAAAYIQAKFKKPIFGFISGRSAPPGKRMGHAGAIISGGKGTPEAKIAAFQAAGVTVSDTLAEMVERAKALG
ncbi:MAG: succinate--CoA ligase subunit alpha [Chloroflexi bacterium]|nr:succinate--CoA ligase subunit alpha [Chloroflexota bacterium]